VRIGDVLRRRRLDAGLSAEQVGQVIRRELVAMGLPGTALEYGAGDAVQDYERRAGWLCPVRVLVAWSAALGVEAGEVVRQVDEWI